MALREIRNLARRCAARDAVEDPSLAIAADTVLTLNTIPVARRLAPDLPKARQ